MKSRSTLQNSGYDQEEAYFYRKDRELIEKLQQNLNRTKLKLVENEELKNKPSPALHNKEKKAA